MKQAEKVVGVIFPSRDDATGVVQPGKQSFDLPAPPGAPQASAILCELATSAAMRGDHLDAVGGHQGLIKRVAVVAAIADQPRREVREEAGVEGRGDDVRLIQ